MDWAIECRELTKTFQDYTAVDKVNLQIPQGIVYGLLGPNGAGKTTLIRLLMGIFRPTSGTGAILGRSITDETGAVRQSVGYVADVQDYYPQMTAEELLDFCRGLYPSWDRDKERWLLKQFHVPMGKWIRAFSKGMKTMLALTIALSIRPQVLILDEPTSGLDPVIKRMFWQLVLEETAAEGMTVFLSTHHLRELERFADKVGVLFDGRLLQEQSIEQLKASSRKLQVVFPAGFPEPLRRLPEVLSVEARGRVYTIVVATRWEQVYQQVQAYEPLFVETLDMELEEIFLYWMSKEGYGDAWRHVG
ncbi:ATP-binding cassette domain-containing protein [Heliobacterium undosum]|uniref:ATP-binding cassette domain-containing protein n=1 Tax=Heliomicrobium undosum TaxID=121734 RepID=A0A845KZK2_9FIRM|nr:ABC transporter ATP-binding protein [Heliomicrobium undosum]MZP29213.1 ATP-binding cassette domain-containing protein [Heliomicrobium undosum]